MLSRRKFTFGSALSFLVSPAVAQTSSGAADDQVPLCKAVESQQGIWETRSTVLAAIGDGPARSSATLESSSDAWLFTRENGEWSQVSATGQLTLSSRADIGKTPSRLTVNLTVPTRYVDETGQDRQLIPLADTTKTTTLNVGYKVDILNGSDRTPVGEGQKEMRFNPSRATYTLSLSVSRDRVEVDSGALSFAFAITDEFGLGVSADITGFRTAYQQVDASLQKLSGDVAAGRCKPVRASCFVVTAANAAQASGRYTADLDLILLARDGLLQGLPQYHRAAAHYYDTAPALAERLRRSNHGPEVFRTFLTRWVRPAEWAMRRGWTRMGFVILGLGIERLYARHAPDVPPPSAYVPNGWATRPDGPAPLDMPAPPGPV